MGKHFPEFLEMSTTSRAIAKFSKISYQEHLFHLIFFPELLECLVEWFVFQEFNNFSYSETFQGNSISHAICPAMKSSRTFVEWNVATITYNNTMNLIMVRVVMSRATRVPCLSFFLSTCCDKIKQS